MEPGEELASKCLSALGHRVESIPRGEGSTADLRVIDDDNCVYYVEVKEKYDAPEVEREQKACVDRGDIYERSDLLAHNNRISAIFHHAKTQLDQTPKSAGSFQLIWLHSEGPDGDSKHDQAFATFYGQV